MRNCEERITDRCWEYARWLPEMQLYQPAMALILRTIAPTPPSARPAYTPLYKMLENAKLSQARSRSIALTKLLINRADFSTNHHPDRHPFMINNFFPINRSKENLKEQIQLKPENINDPNLTYLFNGSEFPLLILQIALRLLPRIYLQITGKVERQEEECGSLNCTKPKNDSQHKSMVSNYSLKRICDELGDDPSTGTGETIDQSLWHAFPRKMISSLGKNLAWFNLMVKKRWSLQGLSLTLDFSGSKFYYAPFHHVCSAKWVFVPFKAKRKAADVSVGCSVDAWQNYPRTKI